VRTSPINLEFFFNRPLDFAAMSQVVSWLEQHWSDIGVMEKAA
jgi:hypothetical protein